MLEQRIQQQFFDSADLKYAAAESLAKPIADAVGAVVGCITGGGKVLACGSGASSFIARHFAAALVGRFERERPGLAAVALGADTDEAPAAALAKQVQALGAPGDVLVVVTPSGDAPDAVAAVDAARGKEMTVVVLAGRAAGRLGAMLTETDVLVAVPHDRPARLQEVHLLVLHCVCDAVDLQLLGEQEPT
jgi:D-sedoheptulose 7-phosphate isomerase